MLYRLSNPAPGRRITSPYGMRKHPISGAIRKHRGIDYGGTFDVLSAGDGIVHRISYNGSKTSGAGHAVVIKHANDCYTAYFHGAQRTQLKEGDRVKVGDFIYRSGSTGASTGPHLHFEVRRTPVWGTDTDPGPYLNATTGGETGVNIVRVTGRLDRTTWKAWQEVLRDHGYIGIIDGIPGPMTYSAIQRSVGATVDGNFGPQTRRKVQEHLKKRGYYTMAIDGVWGRGTIGALQRCLNDGKY
jgi:murein DD-endopeptidase MepM/ murein hydrolase activator NlpD